MSEDEHVTPHPAPKRQKTTTQSMDLNSEALCTLLDEAVRRQLAAHGTTTTPHGGAGISSSTSEFKLSHVKAVLPVVFSVGMERGCASGGHLAGPALLVGRGQTAVGDGMRSSCHADSQLGSLPGTQEVADLGLPLVPDDVRDKAKGHMATQQLSGAGGLPGHRERSPSGDPSGKSQREGEDLPRIRA